MPEAIVKDALYSVEDLADLLRIKPTAVRQLIRLGKIPAAKIGRRWYVRGSNLLAIVPSQQEEV